MVRIVEWAAEKPQSKIVTKFLARSAFPEEAEKAAAEVLAAIRAEGDPPLRGMSRSSRARISRRSASA